jgi:hypothetical protein
VTRFWSAGEIVGAVGELAALAGSATLPPAGGAAAVT